MPEKAKVPAIRFKGFTDAWEQRKAKELCSITTGKSNTQDQVDDGLYPFFIRSEVPVKSNRYLYDEEAVITIGDGNIGRVFHYVNGKFDLHQRCYKMVDFKGLTAKYFYYFFSTKFYKRAMAMTAKATVDSVRLEMISEMDIMYPTDLSEQEEITELLTNLDNLITLHQRKLLKLKNVKKAMLEKMFPKNGSNVPEIRFAGFTDAWEQRKLSDMTDYKNGKGHEDRQSDSGKYELINLNSISIDGGLKYSGKFVDVIADTLLEKDLVMVLSDVGHGDLLGRVALIPENDRFVLNQRVALLRPNGTVDPQFLFSHINAHQQYFKSQGAGMSQLNISKGSVESFTSCIPHKEEQIKIGDLFKNLDNLITLHQRKYEKLQNLKKACLEKMFV